MKFSFSALKKKVHRTSSRAEGSDVLRFMNPNRDWLIGLALATAIFIAGVGYIAYDFYQQFGAPGQAVVVNEQPIVYQDKEVVRHAAYYREREERFNALREDRVYANPPIADNPEEESEPVPAGELLVE